MSPASSIKRYADKWRAEQDHRVSHSCARLASKGVLVPKGRDIPPVVFAREEGRDMRCFGYNRHAGNAGDAEGVQIGDFSRDPGT